MIKNLTKKKKKKGFTLIELIIVIAIIAILAAIAIPKFSEVRKSANQKADIANAKTIANAAATLYADGKVKDDATATATTGTEVKKATATAATNGEIIADYLQSVPTSKTSNGTSFYVKITKGDIVVTIGEGKASGEVIAYPTPDSTLQ